MNFPLAAKTSNTGSNLIVSLEGKISTPLS